MKSKEENSDREEQENQYDSENEDAENEEDEDDETFGSDDDNYNKKSGLLDSQEFSIDVSSNLIHKIHKILE